jgi:hypothetical protein
MYIQQNSAVLRLYDQLSLAFAIRVLGNVGDWHQSKLKILFSASEMGSASYMLSKPNQKKHI